MLVMREAAGVRVRQRRHSFDCAPPVCPVKNQTLEAGAQAVERQGGRE